MESEEMVVDETVLGEEEIGPFDWEDYLYESWLEEHQRKGKGKVAETRI